MTEHRMKHNIFLRQPVKFHAASLATVKKLVSDTGSSAGDQEITESNRSQIVLLQPLHTHQTNFFTFLITSDLKCWKVDFKVQPNTSIICYKKQHA